jgi:formamidopyrimidine-DNA glycosylase
MPELPELEVVRDVLIRRIAGTKINAVNILPPGGAVVIRDLTNLGFAESLTGTTIKTIARRGKFLLFSLERDDAKFFIVINPKLSGRLQLASPNDKRMPKTHILFLLSSGDELRYVDQKQMGQVYLTRDVETVPEFSGMGPEALDVSREDFREQLKKFRGEIKGILTRKEFVAGIGNAYADEILFAARLHPYRKRTQLTTQEIDQLYDAMQLTLREATEKVRAEMGEQVHLKPRDFMAVHMKSGEPCPRCGTAISLVGANQRITNFCRTCQPGGLIKGM